MKVLITGAGGAIGVHVLKRVLEQTDWEVIATDSFRHKGYLDRLEQFKEYTKDRLSIMVHDLTIPFSARQIEKLKGIDAIINLASLSDVEDSIVNPGPFIMNNTALMINMLELSRVIEPTWFIQFSTDEVYGPDTSEGHGHKEWDTILPSNPYAASKAAQEAIAISYWRSYGVPLIITNTMNNFGEMQGPDKYPVKIQKAIMSNEEVSVHVANDGSIGSRFYVHSENVADAVIFLICYRKPYKHQSGHLDRPDRYNIVGDAHKDNLELALDIADLMGKNIRYKMVNFHKNRPGHDVHYGLDGGKLKTLGWEPPRSYKESLKATIDWQTKNPEWIS